MIDPSAFDTPIRREEATALHMELVNRLHQRGLQIADTTPADELSDLFSALDDFEAAVEQAGGDLFINTLDSSEPERPEFVVPRQHDDETVKSYTARVLAAAEMVRRTYGNRRAN